jgi:futalosine hydrolase
LIVPTQFELECLSSSFRAQIRQSDWQLELCGFGIVVSGLRTCELISLYSPKQVLLIGIAGALDNRFLVGQAAQFDEVACFGIGAGSGDHFLSAHEMGWHQWPHAPEIADSISLRQPFVAGLAEQHATLLTCCSASATAQDVEWKLKKYPNAVAEDMEGFAVAAACRFAGIPLTIVRGISNRAGDRNKENWRVREAMLAVEQQVSKVLNL